MATPWKKSTTAATGAGRLKDKIAFITGGTSGIGLATARVFVNEGARVAVTGRNRERLDAVIADLGKDAIGFVADVDHDGAMADALASAAEAFGGLHILFANAGRYIDAKLGSTSRETFEAVLATNVTGVFMTVQSALPYLRERASIIVNGSTYATMGQPGANAYGAGKGAAAAMARTMASELAPRGIRVNVIVPGAIETPSWGFDSLDAEKRAQHIRLLGERSLLNRMLTAEEVANAVLFLASDESSGVQAAELVVDGGTTGAPAGSPRYRKGEPGS
jgi:NAD(P)-dependent dehydrogenase (short-subunit alcohol dehydrogenase family)